MLGSPNYFQGVDSVNRNSTTIPTPTMIASEKIEAVMTAFFDQQQVLHQPSPIDVPGRSDYAPVGGWVCM
jgi:hypothetical protein